MVNDTDRGQAFTLEAIVAALVLLASIGFVLQLTTVTPLSSSSSNQHLEGQHAALADGLLDQARSNGTLRPALLYWDDARGAFHNSSAKGYYTECGMPLPFGSLLERTFAARGTACNVNVQFVTAGGQLRDERLIFVGTPTDNAVRGAVTVTLYDDDVLYDSSGEPTTRRLQNASTFYAPDAAPNSSVYNVVQVEVVVWRM